MSAPARALDAESVLAEAKAMRERLDPSSFSVEAIARVHLGVELLVGARRDPRFGPVLAIGFGGVFAEALGDVVRLLAPTSPSEIERELRGLRGDDLLRGARGRPSLDVPRLANLGAAVARVLAEHPELDDVDCNPVLVLEQVAIALDARIEQGASDAH